MCELRLHTLYLFDSVYNIPWTVYSVYTENTTNKLDIVICLLVNFAYIALIKYRLKISVIIM